MKPPHSPIYLSDESLSDGIALFFFAQRDFAKAADGPLAAQGLGRAHQRVLHFAGRHEGLTMSDLMAILGVTKQSLARVMRDLIGKGFIALETGARDKRQRVVTLTGRGLALTAEIATAQRTWFAKAYRAAGPDAVQGFRTVLAGLLAGAERQGVLRLIAKAKV